MGSSWRMNMKARMMSHIPLFIVLLLLSGSCRAGLVTTTGKEWHRWTEDHYCVLAARVREIEQAKGDAGRFGVWFATLEPLAVFAGSYDPSESPSFDVSVYIGGAGTSIQDDPPKKGATILAVVQNGNFIVSDICDFMPHGSAMVEINGLGDPRVIEAIKKIHDAREHPDPNPYHVSRPATRPSAPAARKK